MVPMTCVSRTGNGWVLINMFIDAGSEKNGTLYIFHGGDLRLMHRQLSLHTQGDVLETNAVLCQSDWKTQAKW